MMVPTKIYNNNLDVYEAARRRMRWVMREFPQVIVLYSGGKDSIVCFNLALEAAREMGRLPLNVMFLDQEIEWDNTIKMVRSVMTHPDVKPYWMQIPFKLSNATSVEENWLNVWDPEKEAVWMRPKEEMSIKENTFGSDRFHRLLAEIPMQLLNVTPENRCAVIGGVRCEESPVRALGLTMQSTWKWATWGKKEFAARGFYTMYPIYDWSFADVWKAIHSNGWAYNHIYDLQFQHGVPVSSMRISNLHHETSIEALFHVHLFEGDTWNRAVRRLKGLQTAAAMGYADYYPTELPPMFRDWWEYRDFLLERLITNPEWREVMRKRFAHEEAKFRADLGDSVAKSHITACLTNDWEGVKSDGFCVAAAVKMKNIRRERNARSASQV